MSSLIQVPTLFLHILGFVQTESVEELLQECAKMYGFEHPNVLKLCGVCLDGGPAPYVIMPFMANGSLLSYLKDERENLVLDPGTSDKMVIKLMQGLALDIQNITGYYLVHAMFKL